MACVTCNSSPCLCSLGEKLTGIKCTVDAHWSYKEASDKVMDELWELLYNICIIDQRHLQFRFEKQIKRVEELNKKIEGYHI